ncbi:DUF2513 domain-containing protein [Priestia endophytica]|uniref:DUF2513 domain-containing protein n=1 Tax=Priestia endophytica TaxID=135735 RepID=UPI00124CB6C8|nr:DUF2513 domain-containing protein [Priestia endophytica]KAB2488381.1 DUF2513 domain-containing protein [Priestia endophytica]
MKRDKALMLEILIRIELSEKNHLYIDREMEPGMIDTLYFHVTLLGEAGYVTYNRVFADDELKVFQARLTNKGYDYLEDLVANQEMNSKLSEAKNLITKTTNWTMTNVISPLLLEYTKTLIFPSK